MAVTRQMDDETSKDVEGVKKDEYDVLRERMKGLTNAIEDSSCNWYEEEMYSVQKILVLMDVIAFAEPGCLQENKHRRDRIKRLSLCRKTHIFLKKYQKKL